MAAKEHPLLRALAKAQYDLTSAQAWLAEVRRQLSDLDLAETPRHNCQCGLSFKSAEKLAEHRYLSHDGCEPAHWLTSEELAAVDLVREHHREESEAA
jgi:hypothetical protein